LFDFVKRRKELVKEMEKDKAGFFFAITAINIAFWMKKYFHLADFLVAGKDIAVYCNRRALKNFCRLLTDNEEAYMDMHELFLAYFYTKLWVGAQSKNNQTLLQFNQLFEQLINLIKSIFENEELVEYG
jgi:ELMO domain-containing protein